MPDMVDETPVDVPSEPEQMPDMTDMEADTENNVSPCYGIEYIKSNTSRIRYTRM